MTSQHEVIEKYLRSCRPGEVIRLPSERSSLAPSSRGSLGCEIHLLVKVIAYETDEVIGAYTDLTRAEADRSLLERANPHADRWIVQTVPVTR